VYRAVNTLHFGYKDQSLNVCKEKVAVGSEIRTEHINAMWASRRISEMLNLVICKVTVTLKG
jgi:hypothetical protein